MAINVNVMNNTGAIIYNVYFSQEEDEEAYFKIPIRTADMPWYYKLYVHVIESFLDIFHIQIKNVKLFSMQLNFLIFYYRVGMYCWPLTDAKPIQLA